VSATTGVPQSTPAPPVAPAASPWAGPGRLAAAATILVGIGLRAVAVSGALGRPDSDEVLSGLLARHIWTDGWPAFLWGQHYGGTAEALPVAVSYALFGPSTLALRLPTLVLAAVAAVLVWRCARRLMSPGSARVAGLLAWVWPPAAVWFATREQLFYGPTVVIGLVAILLALRRADPVARRQSFTALAAVEWGALGLALGLGWWTSPNIMYFAVPVVAVLLLAKDRPGRVSWPSGAGIVTVAAGAIVGALPWLVTNVGSGFPSLGDTDGFTANGSYADRLSWYVSHGLPAELGFRQIGTLHWVGGALGVVAYLAALVGLAVAGRRALARQGRLAPGADLVGFVVFPFIFATIPFGMDQANLRYLFFLAPFLALLGARLVVGPRTAAAVLVGAMVITGIGFVRLDQLTNSADSSFRIGRSGELGGVIAALAAAHLDAVHADYWVAYRLTFESDERIIASPSAGALRSATAETFVRNRPRAAWVVDADSAQEAALLDALDHLGVASRVVVAGEYAVVFTGDRNVQPEELPDAARAPVGSERPPPPGHTY
jgi:hypothetical protein